MAVQTYTRQPPARFSNLPASNDRAKAFRAAKRHSAQVAVLRFALPVCAVLISALYFIPQKVTVEVDGGEASIDGIEIARDGLKMVNPRINGVHEKHGIYDIRADSATQQIKHPELITLDEVSAKLTSNSNETTILTAPSGIYHSKKEELTFADGVTIGGSAGLTGKLKTATAFFQTHKLISTDPVDLSFHENSIKAESMTLFSSERRAIFQGNVKVHLQRTPETGQK